VLLVQTTLLLLLAILLELILRRKPSWCIAAEEDLKRTTHLADMIMSTFGKKNSAAALKKSRLSTPKVLTGPFRTLMELDGERMATAELRSQRVLVSATSTPEPTLPLQSGCSKMKSDP